MDHEGIDIGAGFSYLFLQAEHCANHFPRIGLCDDVSEKIFLRFDQILQKKKNMRKMETDSSLYLEIICLMMTTKIIIQGLSLYLND